MFAWQHGPHRQGLGAILEKVIEPLFRWNSRTESFVVGGVVTVAAVCALYLKKRLYGRFSVTDVLIAGIFFIPGQFASLVLYANFAHGPLPLLLIVVYCLGWTWSNTLARYSLILVINFLTIYTGFGLLLGLLTPFLLILDYQASRPETRVFKAYLTSAITISLASLASFFVGYKFDAAVDCFSPQPASPTAYIQYSGLMLANFFGIEHGIGFPQVLVGILVIAALLVSVFVCAWKLVRKQNGDPDSHRRRLVITCLTAYCLLFCFATAYGRLCSGLETAHASRYIMYLELGMLGLYFQVLDITRSRRRWLFLGVLTVGVFAACWHLDLGEVSSLPIAKWRWKNCYLQTGSIDRCNAAVGFPVYPDAARTHLQEKLDFLKKNRLNLFANSK